MPKPIPEGLHAVTPHLTVDGTADAIETWKKAFGAEELMRAPDPTGKKIWHASVRLWLYSDGVDRAFERAKAAGLKVAMPPADMFWGDRIAEVHDRWGNQWVLAQHVKDLSPAEMKKAQDEFVAKMKK